MKALPSTLPLQGQPLLKFGADPSYFFVCLFIEMFYLNLTQICMCLLFLISFNELRLYYEYNVYLDLSPQQYISDIVSCQLCVVTLF